MTLKSHHMRGRRPGLLWALMAGAWVGAVHAQPVSEADFLAEVPVVLSVSRLAQRLDEAPAAVSVIDRDWIARSGARHVADLLRLLPGFQTSLAFESVAPLAAYHGGFDAYSHRMQVLVDGRSVYSLYFIGSSASGLETVSLDDIERIEVVRGSNSATHGARAMLGVVNIITRDPHDTLGLRWRSARGSNAVHDQSARLGWGLDDGGAMRLSLDQTGDDGLQGANGRNRVDRVNFRLDRRLGGDDLQLRLGSLRIAAGKGLLGTIEARPTAFDNGYVQLDWRHSVDADHDWAVQASAMRETYRDAISAVPGLNINFDGNALTQDLTLTHTARQSSILRSVWGAQWHHERIDSAAFFGTAAPQATDFTRVFSNVEWRFAPTWLVNVGALAEHSSDSGDSVAPRWMVNWQPVPGHTLRAGMSVAYRPPSRFERAAQLYYPGIIWVQPSGSVQPERLTATELGYRLDAPQRGLELDVRVFHEQVDGFVRMLTAINPRDYINDEDFAIRGAEYQVQWQPWAGARLIWAQTYTEIGAQRVGTGTAWAAPRLANSLVWLQKLPYGVDFNLAHQDSGTATLMGAGVGDLMALTRTDLRLAKAWRWNGRRAELSWTVQNSGSPLPDFDQRFALPSQRFVTLTLEL